MPASAPLSSSGKVSFKQALQLQRLAGQRPPSTGSVLDNTLGAITGFKPSELGKGLYAWRHPIGMYNVMQKQTGGTQGMIPFAPGGNEFKFLDVSHPEEMTMWHNGPPKTIAETNRMLGADGDPFHLHATSNGRPVAAMHGANSPTNIHISSVFTDPGFRGKGLAGTMHSKVFSAAAKLGKTVSSDYENTALGNSMGKLAIKNGFKVHVDPATMRTHFYKPLP